MNTLAAFTPEEKARAKILLATAVAKMMGRKFEEDDWATVYCQTKGIPKGNWSNLHIDVMHQGLGVEHKMLCIGGESPLLNTAGTTLMHPSATRSIRLDNIDIPAHDAMVSVFAQYKDLIEQRTERVRTTAGDKCVDMRTGWLLWERSLTEFIYFEEPMTAPDPAQFFAEWNERPARGIRKPSKNLWIYERNTNKKRYSVTTSAGIKIQPYFDVPQPKDPHLVYFRVQSEPVGTEHVRIWITAESAQRLREVTHDDSLGSLSQCILAVAEKAQENTHTAEANVNLAVPVHITKQAHTVLQQTWDGVSDEHRIQLLLQTLTR